MFKPDPRFMQKAIDEAIANLNDEGGGPFGACIIKNGQLLAVAHNTVLKTHDPTCHAEINAIRLASQELKNHNLSGCVIYSTTEPCPMCFSAIHWAKIDTIIYGTRIEDAQDMGFNELTVSNEVLKQEGGSPLALVPDFMRDECLEVFRQWKSTTDAITY